MAKSRTAPGLILLAGIAAAPAAAQPLTAEEAIAAHQATVREVVAPDCRSAAEPGDIVVCGRPGEEERYRVPYAAPLRSADRAGGEQLTAMQAGSSTCTTVGLDQRCNGGLDLFTIGSLFATGLRNLIERGDE